MKRLAIMLFVAGILVGPSMGWAQQVADSFVYPVDNYQSTLCFDWGEYRGGSRHVAQDVQCSNPGAQVRSSANGEVMLAEPHGCVCSGDPCYGNWGTIVVIEHTLSDGSKVCTIYGHISYSVSEGAFVTKNQSIGSVADLSCPEGWTDHVHFGVYDGAFGASVGTYPSWLHGYLPPESFPGNYRKPDDFINSHQTPAYHCTWDSQNPSDITVQPGDIINIWVKYRNTGTEYWTNNQNVGDPHSVELWSCDASGTIVNSWFEPVNWVGCPGACSDRRVTGADETTVNPNGIATFTFQAKVPDNAQPQDVRVWFRPTHGGQVMDDWGGMNIYIHVRNPPPPGVSLSFEDSNGDNTPDGWLQVAFNGGMYNYPSGGAVDGSRYVSFTHTDGSQWNAIGTPASGIIAAGTLYRLEFWYRTTSTSPFSWRLGASDIAAASLPINCTVSSPLNDGQWHHFWSAPFSVSSSDLANYPNLAFYYDYGTIGTVDTDWVNVIPTSPCP